MAEIDIKIIKYTIIRLLAGWEQSKHESLIRGLDHRGIGESIIHNELDEHQVSADIMSAVMQEFSVDWFELAVKVFDKKIC